MSSKHILTLAGLFNVLLAGPVLADGEAVPSLSAFDVPPKLIHMPEVEYPEEAREALCEGNVFVHMSIDAAGRVLSAEVVEMQESEISPAHCPGIDASALEAAEGCLFEPATLDGRPVEGSVLLPFEFRLRDSEK